MAAETICTNKKELAFLHLNACITYALESEVAICALFIAHYIALQMCKNPVAMESSGEKSEKSHHATQIINFKVDSEQIWGRYFENVISYILLVTFRQCN